MSQLFDIFMKIRYNQNLKNLFITFPRKIFKVKGFEHKMRKTLNPDNDKCNPLDKVQIFPKNMMIIFGI